MARRSTHRSGNNAIEFALLLPVLLTLVFGAIEYSWYFVQYEAVVRAAQVGVRAGSQIKRTANPSPQTTAADVAKSTLTTSQPALGATATATGSVLTNNTVQILLSAPYKPLIKFVPTPATVTYTAVMRLEDTT